MQHRTVVEDLRNDVELHVCMLMNIAVVLNIMGLTKGTLRDTYA